MSDPAVEMQNQVKWLRAKSSTVRSMILSCTLAWAPASVADIGYVARARRQDHSIYAADRLLYITEGSGIDSGASIQLSMWFCCIPSFFCSKSEPLELAWPVGSPW